MFEQDVAGLIKSLRSNKNEEIKVINKTLLEIKKEIKSKDFDIKSNSILKLVYLEMLGYSISFSNFTIIECMSSVKFNIKFIGYLAASQCFDKETEVAVLIVNLVKKDLLSPPTSSIFTTSPTSLTTSHLLITLSSISLLLSSPTLSRDLAPTLLSLLNHSKPLIRKQSLLVLFKLVKSYPAVKELSDGLSSSTLDFDDSTTTTTERNDPWIERLRERLSDSDLGVVSATVNLICELARTDIDSRASYLSLAPELFSLLTGSTNNWMLIKIIKLFAVLTPIEPRLIKKLVPPLTELIETTSAMSLLFECIQTSIVGGILSGSREGERLADICVGKLKGFLEDSDQNLRYIALVALSKILPTHPHLVSKHSKIILNCIDDEDMSIRSRALDLVEGMVDRTSLEIVVERLMGHLISSPSSTTGGKGSITAAQLLQQASTSKPSTPTTPILLSTSYKISLISLILRMCSTNSTYSNVSNFNWYIDILVQLSYIAATLSLSLPSSSSTLSNSPSLGKQLKNDLIDVSARVRAIRNYSVEKMSELVGDDEFLVGGGGGGGAGSGSEIEEVLGAAAWICGEYCRELENPPSTIASLFSPSSLLNSSPKILAQYYHNGLKLYSYWLSTLASTSTWDESIHKDSVREVTIALMGKLGSVGLSGEVGDDVELLERCSEAKGLLDLVRKGLDGPRIVRRETSPSFNSNGFNNDNDAEEGGFNAPLEPPLALLLLTKLFTSHELNPVNSKAQSMVQIPDGLDLNLVINPTSMRRSPVVEEEKREVDDYGRFIGRVKEEERNESEDRKGKGKERSGGIIRRSRRKEIVEDPVEIAKLKAERLERQRDDPYYVGSSAPLASYLHQQDLDVDSIPIVQLSIDDFNGLPSHSSTIPPPSRRIRTPPPPVFVDLEGEMPDSIPSSNRSTPIPQLQPEEEKDKGEVNEEKEKSAERRAEEGLAIKVVKKKSKKDSSANTISGEKKKRKEKKVVVEE